MYTQERKCEFNETHGVSSDEWKLCANYLRKRCTESWNKNASLFAYELYKKSRVVSLVIILRFVHSEYSYHSLICLRDSDERYESISFSKCRNNQGKHNGCIDLRKPDVSSRLALYDLFAIPFSVISWWSIGQDYLRVHENVSYRVRGIWHSRVREPSIVPVRTWCQCAETAQEPRGSPAVTGSTERLR